MNTDLILYPILLIIGAVLIVGLIMFIIHIYRLYKKYKKLYIDYKKLYIDYKKSYNSLDEDYSYLFNMIYKDEILNYFKPIIRRGTIKEEIVTFAEYRYDLKTKKATLYAKRKNPKTNKLEPVRVDLSFQED